MERTTGEQLILGPLPVDGGPAPTKYYGCIDEVTDEFVAGWVVRGDGSAELLSLDVLLDGALVGRGFTDKFRADIARTMGTNLTAGFRIEFCDWDLTEDVVGKLETSLRLALRVTGTDMYLVPEKSEISAEMLRRIADVRHARGLTEPRAFEVRDPAEQVTPRGAVADVRLIAFFLPQFHPIVENDAWWGAGFTEWSNVSRARRLFSEHHQPRLPADLGFYDLRVPEVREQQAELAREHGIHGFCYYYYWFSGRRLLERPLNEVLATGKPDFPFCICWANENWTRRWDGSEHDVLLGQTHSLENDIAFIRDVLPVLRDPRYIKVGGLPLLLVYRASLLKDPRRTTSEWRRICASAGLPGIHLAMVESFGDSDPSAYGFDAAVEFPPHCLSAREINGELANLAEDYEGKVYDYAEALENALATPDPPYRRYRGVMTGWDNTPRAGKSATIFLNSSPRHYEVWLRGVIDQTVTRHAPDNRLIFINAWNEWAEGAHLEPDMMHGRAYLHATRDAVLGRSHWNVLLQQMRSANGMTKPDLARLADRLEEAFVAQERSTRFLRNKVHQLTPFPRLTVFSPYAPESISGRGTVVGGQAHLEIAGARSNLEDAIFSSDETLLLGGWWFCENVPLEPTTACYLAAESLLTRRTYYATIHQRAERPDVVAAHPHVPERVTLYSGFSLSASLTTLPPGQYALKLMLPTDSHAIVTPLTGRMTVVGAAR